MSLSVFASGTQTCVIGTEHALATTSAAGVFSYQLDLTNAATGDTFELRVKTKILGAGATVVFFKDSYVDGQNVDDLGKICIPLPADQPVVFTIKQTAGTGRSIPWKVLSL